MFLYFIGALIVGAIIYKMGVYATIISLMATAGKVAVVLLLVAGLVLLFRKFRKQPRIYRLPGVTDK